MSIICYNAKLKFDNDNDKQKLLYVLQYEQKALNECLKLRFKSNLNIVGLHKKFYKKFRKQNKDCPSQVVIRAETECLSIFQSIRKNHHKIKKPPQKRRLSMQLDKRLYTYCKDENTFRLTTCEHRINVGIVLYTKLEQLLSTYTFKDPKLFVKDDEIYIILPFEIDVEQQNKPNKLCLGVDLGIRRFAVTSEGKSFVDKTFLKQKRKLRYLKRCLQSKQTDSSKRHLQKLRRKERHINKNFNHHLANKILQTKADTIVLENLQVNKLKRKKHKYQNKNRISQVGFSNLLNILTYKAELVGKRVVLVNPAYTSQIDSVTGKCDGKRVGCRYYSKRGLVYDADYNASLNIAKLAKLPISRGNTPIWQAPVNEPIVTR
jgi:IS605 OrfB family transposase